MEAAGDALPAKNELRGKVRFYCSIVALAAIIASLAIFLVFGPDGDTSFLVRATEPHGLDPVHSPVIHPSFSLTLRVDNRWFKDCWENITVTVFYGNTVVGWGAVPKFCADRRTSVDVKAAMSHTDVVLTDALRGSMASQLSTGDLEFKVEMRMRLSKNQANCEECSSRQGFLFCTVNPGRLSYAPCKLIYLRWPYL